MKKPAFNLVVDQEFYDAVRETAYEHRMNASKFIRFAIIQQMPEKRKKSMTKHIDPYAK